MGHADWWAKAGLLRLDGPTGEAGQLLSVGPWFGLLVGLDLGQIGFGLGQSLGHRPDTKIILKVKIKYKIKYTMISANLNTTQVRHDTN